MGLILWAWPLWVWPLGGLEVKSFGGSGGSEIVGVVWEKSLGGNGGKEELRARSLGGKVGGALYERGEGGGSLLGREGTFSGSGGKGVASLGGRGGRGVSFGISFGGNLGTDPLGPGEPSFGGRPGKPRSGLID